MTPCGRMSLRLIHPPSGRVGASAPGRAVSIFVHGHIFTGVSSFVPRADQRPIAHPAQRANKERASLLRSQERGEAASSDFFVSFAAFVVTLTGGRHLDWPTPLDYSPGIDSKNAVNSAT